MHGSFMFCLFQQFRIGKPMFSDNVVSSIPASITANVVFKKKIPVISIPLRKTINDIKYHSMAEQGFRSSYFVCIDINNRICINKTECCEE